MQNGRTFTYLQFADMPTNTQFMLGGENVCWLKPKEGEIQVINLKTAISHASKATGHVELNYKVVRTIDLGIILGNKKEEVEKVRLDSVPVAFTLHGLSENILSKKTVCGMSNLLLVTF